MTMIIKIGIDEKGIMSISGYYHDNYGCCPLDNYETISQLPNCLTPFTNSSTWNKKEN